MRVLFLDIDGVLVTPSSRQASRRNIAADPAKITMLHALLVEADASIVISSTWRASHDMPGILLEQWPDAPLHEDWRTGHWSDIAPEATSAFRGVEIADWLKKHPQVSAYAIVDDETGFLPDQIDHVVMTDPIRGLDSHDAQLIHERLVGYPRLLAGSLI